MHQQRFSLPVRRPAGVLRSFCLAAALMVVAALAACSSSTAGPVRSAVSSSASPNSSPASSTPAAPPVSPGPLAGGIEFLRAYQTLGDTNALPLNVINNPHSNGLVQVVPAARKLAAGERTFDAAVRATTVADSARIDVNTLLTGANSLIAALDQAGLATNLASLNARMSVVSSTGQAADAQEVKVGDDLGVFTDKPTSHLAAPALPVVIADLSARPISVEGTATYGATYVPTGYQQVSGARQSVAERATTSLKLTNTTVSTRVVVAGTPDNSGNAASALIICRSSGTGTTSGDEYQLGYNTLGGLFIAHVGPLGIQHLISSSSSLAKSGASIDLRADCIGSYLTLYLNGTPMIQVYDDKLASGNVGLASGGPGATIYSTLSASGDTK